MTTTGKNAPGEDLERIRKVFSEQRAQYIARQDMGTV